MQIIKLCKTINYLINSGLLINHNNNPVVMPRILYIEEGQIAAIVSPEDPPFTFHNPNRKTISFNLNQATILPPLVDCHVHLALDGINFEKSYRRWGKPEELFKQVKFELFNTLRNGILAVRDGGDRHGLALGFRESVNNGTLAGPMIHASGFALRKPQKYGKFLGRGTPAKALENTLNQLARHKVNQVKVLVSGIISFEEYGLVDPLQYSNLELSTIVHGAHTRGLTVMAHASSNEAVSMAVQAGVDTIEHGYYLNKDTLELMAEKGTSWVPTVIPVYAQINSQTVSSLDQHRHYVLEKIVNRQLAMINEAAAMGVSLGIGTDAGAVGVRHGYGYHEELKLYQNAGLSTEKIINCATVIGANILGLDCGCIEPGSTAVLIAVDGNPLIDINNLKKVQVAFLPSDR